jgi:hypothetical protein
MKTRFAAIIIIILIVPAMISCKENHYKVDVSSIDVKVEIKRLEKDLFSTNPDEIVTKIPLLKQKYNGFLQFFSYVIKAGELTDSTFGEKLTAFCTDKQNNEVYAMTSNLYPDIKTIETGLQGAFRYYLYYFPKRKVPAVFTCITGFNTSIITGDSVLGIGLDRYLGANCKYYPELEIYEYLAVRMTPENIVPDCMFGLAASLWDFSTLKYKNDNVLAEIIHNGKLKYFEKCMLPEVTDELIFGFTANQLKFCQNNESQMWQYLVENDLLFSTDQLTIRKLTGEAPFTSYFTNQSPGRAAAWIGFRIVESYMSKNKNVNPEDLMNNTDVQAILEGARYDPK